MFQQQVHLDPNQTCTFMQIKLIFKLRFIFRHKVTRKWPIGVPYLVLFLSMAPCAVTALVCNICSHPNWPKNTTHIATDYYWHRRKNILNSSFLIANLAWLTTGVRELKKQQTSFISLLRSKKMKTFRRHATISEFHSRGFPITTK